MNNLPDHQTAIAAVTCLGKPAHRASCVCGEYSGKLKTAALALAWVARHRGGICSAGASRDRACGAAAGHLGEHDLVLRTVRED